MGVKNFISENIFLSLSDIVFGRRISQDLALLNRSQWYSKSQIESFQNEKFRTLIRHSYESVPYYRDLMIKLNLKPNDFLNKYDIYKLPVLIKQNIKQEGIDRFTSNKVQKGRLIKSSSSGSTGEPLFYFNTKEAYSMNIAASLRGWYWMGYRLGDRYIKLSQNPRKDPIKRIQDKVSNNLYLATNPLVDSNFNFIMSKIERFKPKVIRCYPDPLLFLARYKISHPEFTYKPSAITTTGNMLFPEIRKEIEDTFGCKIFDSYNCEGNSTVFECPTHTCYHSAEEYGISEVIDENGNPVLKGIGRLITTDLFNFAHPFIRYDTQDYVEIDSEPCVCGRNLLKIMRILGRDNEVLLMPSGRRFIVHNFTGFFQTNIPEINKSIDQFQVIKNKTNVIFKIVVNKRFNSEVSDYIQHHWENELQFPVTVEVVDNIQSSPSGKRRFIINE
jgi:phenylacetate-CoA ligase